MNPSKLRHSQFPHLASLQVGNGEIPIERSQKLLPLRHLSHPAKWLYKGPGPTVFPAASEDDCYGPLITTLAILAPALGSSLGNFSQPTSARNNATLSYENSKFQPSKLRILPHDFYTPRHHKCYAFGVANHTTTASQSFVYNHEHQKSSCSIFRYPIIFKLPNCKKTQVLPYYHKKKLENPSPHEASNSLKWSLPFKTMQIVT